MGQSLIIAALAIGLAMDAFAVAVAQGAAGNSSKFDAARLGIAFGLAQGIMPFLGWVLGIAFIEQISAFDHWIALILLVGLGLKMLFEVRSRADEESAAALSGWTPNVHHHDQADDFGRGVEIPEGTGWFSRSRHRLILPRLTQISIQCICSDRTIARLVKDN